MLLTKRRILGAFLVLLGFGAWQTVGPQERAAQAGGGKAYLQGLDVSHWNGTIDWSSVKNSGRVFAFCKATEGTTYIDTKFYTNWPQMNNVGLVRGAYHFGRPASDPIAQAQFFYNVVQPTSGDLQMTLDLEVTDGKPPDQVWAWTIYFIGKIKRLTGRPGISYTGYYFWRDQVGNPSYNLDCPLWIAAWNTSAPKIPSAWSTWTFWQYSSTGSVPGVSGKCDLDYFNGSY